MKTVLILKALSDETRIRIINILKEGPLCVCEIEAILQISQSNASRHLNKLMNQDVVNYYKEAKYVYYKLNEKTISECKFIDLILKEQLEKEENLNYDMKILNAYNEAGLNCETVSQTKEIIERINKENN